jgi:hypothetical protein
LPLPKENAPFTVEKKSGFWADQTARKGPFWHRFARFLTFSLDRARPVSLFAKREMGGAALRRRAAPPAGVLPSLVPALWAGIHPFSVREHQQFIWIPEYLQLSVFKIHILALGDNFENGNFEIWQN